MRDFPWLVRKIHLRLIHLFQSFSIQLVDRYYSFRCHCQLKALGYSRPITLVRRLYNVVVVTDGEYYFKIGYARPNTVQYEYNNCKELAVKFPLLEKYLPEVSFFTVGDWPCMRSLAMQPVDNQLVKGYAVKVVTDFVSQGEYRLGSLEELYWVEEGINVLGNIVIDNHDLRSRVLDILGRTRFHYGPCHGDFHRANLLSKNGSAPALIDLDCFRLCSIQELDILYFNIEEVSARELIGWPDILERYLENLGLYDFESFVPSVNVSDPRLVFIYILDRIGQEAKYHIFQNGNKINKLIGMVASEIECSAELR